MQEYTKRRLFGQYFLRSPKIAASFVKAAELTSNDHVLEIGPGQGQITRYIAPKTKWITLVEKDYELSNLLFMKMIDYDTINVICDDILQIDWDSIYRGTKFKVISNTPYSCSKKILLMIIMYGDIISLSILGVQQEVANTILRRSTAMGRFIAMCCDVEKVCDISPLMYIPVPKVKSTVLKLRLRKTYSCMWLDLLQRLYATGNKMLRNNQMIIDKALEICANKRFILQKRPSELDDSDVRYLLSLYN